MPYCPGWVRRDVVAHLGWVYRWVAATVREARPAPPDRAERAALEDPDPADAAGLLERFAGAHAGLVRALAEAPDDLACWTPWPADRPRAFWLRRQVHETLVHRVDVGAGADLAPALAADGVDELVRGFISRFAADLRHPTWATLALQAADTGDRWWVRIGPGGPVSGLGDPPAGADAEVRAPAADLYLLLWNRREPAGLDVRGDPAVLDAWRRGKRR